MAKIICVDQKYSTTRLLTRDRPEIEFNPEAKVESISLSLKSEGGLRTQGYFKASQAGKPLITIVTVVYNGESFLEETIQSVINQSYDNVEYIIIDGGSSDGTLEIICQYQNAIDYWISERDSGIYDAMNKGIDLASGDWINFMNGGDFLHGSHVLEKIFKKQNYQTYQVLYGDHEVNYEARPNRLVKAGFVNDLWKGSQFCHQAAFVSTTYHKTHKFNLSIKIVADFEFFYEAWQCNAKFMMIPEVVCMFESGGVSDVKRIDSIIGWWNVIDKTAKVNLYYIYIVLKEMLKSMIKSALKL